MKIDGDDLKAYKELIDGLREKYDIRGEFRIDDEGEVAPVGPTYGHAPDMRRQFEEARKRGDDMRKEMEKKREEIMADAKKTREDAFTRRAMSTEPSDVPVADTMRARLHDGFSPKTGKGH